MTIQADKSFVTLIFYKVRTPAKRPHDNDPSRKDILKIISNNIRNNLYPTNIFGRNRELIEKQRELLKKTEDIIETPYAYEQFKRTYNNLSQESQASILAGLRSYNLQTLRIFIFYYVLVAFEVILCLFLALTLISIWTKWSFLGLQSVDKSSFLALTAILISCFQLTHSMSKNID